MRKSSSTVVPSIRCGEQGATAVEFALVFPLVMLLTFGIMEMALLLRDYVGVTNAVTDAVRRASALPQKGPAPPTTPELIRASHRGESSPSFAFDAAQVVRDIGAVIPQNQIEDMWIYLANRKGFPVHQSDLRNWWNDTTSSFGTVASGGCPANSCVRFAWEDPDGPGPEPAGFDYRPSPSAPGLWDPATINACAGKETQAMGVGVYLRIKHSSIVSGLLNTDMTVSDSAVLKFEPLASIACKGSLSWP